MSCFIICKIYCIPLNLDSSIRVGHRKVTLATVWQGHMNILHLGTQKDEDRYKDFAQSLPFLTD